MKIICIGRNYVDHIDELKNDIPKNPIIFFKPSICKLEDSDFKIPDFSSDIHHEIEIIYKISKKTNQINLLINNLQLNIKLPMAKHSNVLMFF